MFLCSQVEGVSSSGPGSLQHSLQTATGMHSMAKVLSDLTALPRSSAPVLSLSFQMGFISTGISVSKTLSQAQP